MGAAPSSAASTYKKYCVEKWQAYAQAERENNDPFAKVHPASVSKVPPLHHKPPVVSLQGSINLSGRELLSWHR